MLGKKQSVFLPYIAQQFDFAIDTPKGKVTPKIMQVAEPLVDSGNCPGGKYEYISSQSVLDKGCRALLKLGKKQLLAVDIETSGLEPHNDIIFLISFSCKIGKSYVFDPRVLDPKLFTSVLEKCSIVTHGANFEWPWFKTHYKINTNIEFDTMLARQLLTAGLLKARASLEATTLELLGLHLDKECQTLFQTLHKKSPMLNKQIAYAAGDTCSLLLLQELLTKQLETENLWHIWETLEKPLIPILGEHKYLGIHVDLDHIAKLKEELEQEMRARETNFLKEMNCTRSQLNVDSPKQLLSALRDKGIPADSTDEKVLTYYKEEHKCIELLLDYREVNKLYDYIVQWGDTMYNRKTKRVHSNVKQAATDTGRFSSNSPNSQNLPQDNRFRKMIVPPQGHKVGICVKEGTKVTTNRGSIPIEQICKGDTTLTDTKTVAKVNTVIDNGIQDTLKLTTKLGYELIATPQHRIRILDNKGNYSWKELQHITKEDKIVIQPNNLVDTKQANNETLPEIIYTHSFEKSVTTPNKPTKDLAEFMGYMTGDGHFSKSGPYWVVCDKDPDLNTYLQQLCKSLFGQTPKQILHYRGVFDAQFYSTKLVAWLKSIGGAKTHAPNYLWTSDTETIAAYLRGLFESDGSVSNHPCGRLRFSTVNEQLAIDVQLLLLSIGIVSKRRLQTVKIHKNYWSISIPAAYVKDYKNKIGFISIRKKTELEKLSSRSGEKHQKRSMPSRSQKLKKLNPKGDLYKLLDNIICLERPINIQLAKDLKTTYPNVYKELELYRLLEYNQIYDTIASIENVGQNRVYDLYIPGPLTYISNGFVSHNCDLSQYEVRVLAKASNDETIIKILKDGYEAEQLLKEALKSYNITEVPDQEENADAFAKFIIDYPDIKKYIDQVYTNDFHRVTAASLFGVDPKKVTKDQRNASKSVTFGIPYGAGADTVARRSGMPVKDAQNLIITYFKTYPKIKDYLDGCKNQAKELKYTTTLAGRRRYYDVPKQGDITQNPKEYSKRISIIERAAVNAPIQGTNADTIKLATINLHKDLVQMSDYPYECRIILWVHDEIVTTAPANKIQAVVDASEARLLEAAHVYLEDVPCSVSKEIADTWKK